MTLAVLHLMSHLDSLTNLGLSTFLPCVGSWPVWRDPAFPASSQGSNALEFDISDVLRVSLS